VRLTEEEEEEEEEEEAAGTAAEEEERGGTPPSPLCLCLGGMLVCVREREGGVRRMHGQVRKRAGREKRPARQPDADTNRTNQRTASTLRHAAGSGRVGLHGHAIRLVFWLMIIHAEDTAGQSSGIDKKTLVWQFNSPTK
jgi:hypothetical protein